MVQKLLWDIEPKNLGLNLIVTNIFRKWHRSGDIERCYHISVELRSLPSNVILEAKSQVNILQR